MLAGQLMRLQTLLQIGMRRRIMDLSIRSRRRVLFAAASPMERRRTHDGRLVGREHRSRASTGHLIALARHGMGVMVWLAMCPGDR